MDPPNPGRPTPKQQLSASMEHIRYAVTLPPADSSSPRTEAVDSHSCAADPAVYGVPGSFAPIRKPRTDSSNNPQKRTDPFQFGSRFLEEGDDIFAYNAWDHVETDDAYAAFSEERYAEQRASPVTDFDRKRFNDAPEKWWNKFYKNNKASFFKDRKWLFQEFPVLAAVSCQDAGEKIVLEVGAGAGNTAFPIMKHNTNPHLTLHACDFSKTAVDVMRASDEYRAPDTVGSLVASVWDIAAPLQDDGTPSLPDGLKPASVDVVLLIFIFSALAPDQWRQAIRNVWAVLKPGGTVLFRDYGRGDLAQVRFKKGRYMEENFYVRGDGTRVYFFGEDELRALWTEQALPPANDSINKIGNHTEVTSETTDVGRIQPTKDVAEHHQAYMSHVDPSTCGAPAQFQVLDFGVDRRMLVNRQRRLKMYRCWMQARFMKPDMPSSEATK